MPGTIERRIAVITGACGGMGQALSRTFGADMDLVLTDVGTGRVGGFAEALRDEGYTVVASVEGPLEDDQVLSQLAEAQRAAGRLGALLHTAGLSPTIADWKTILTVNLVATEKLLRAIEPSLESGAVGILIASSGAHMNSPSPELDQILSDPLAVDLMSKVEPFFEARAVRKDTASMEVQSYSASKREVLRICERRSADWARRGARIISLSPGAIFTPMGRREVSGRSLSVVEGTPLGRWGTSMDVASVARFLASDAASFVTGCDLRIDGGLIPAMSRSSL